MNDIISPKYKMNLIKEVAQAIWDEYKTYKEVKYYIDNWHKPEHDEWNNYWENFSIHTKQNGEIDLIPTLNGIDAETILKIAIDMGVETPDFIPAIPTFRNELKASYQTAGATFEKAFKQIELHPDIAIGLANSTLESIIKEILKDERIESKIKSTETLYGQTQELLKVLLLFPGSKMPPEIRTIGSSLLSMNQSIEKLRSEKTSVHGKTSEEHIIEDPLYAYFIFNSVVTVGLFLSSYYKKKFPPRSKPSNDPIDDLPF